MSTTTTPTPTVLADAHLGRLASALGDTEPATAEPPDLTPRQFDAALAELPGAVVNVTDTVVRTSDGKWSRRVGAWAWGEGVITRRHDTDSLRELLGRLRADFSK